MDILEHHSFSGIIRQAQLGTKVYARSSDAIEAVDLISMIEQLGDRILGMARRGDLSVPRAERLIADLLACYAEPLKDARRIIEISREIREGAR